MITGEKQRYSSPWVAVDNAHRRPITTRQPTAWCSSGREEGGAWAPPRLSDLAGRGGAG